MEQIDTIAVEAAFSDLISELNKIKDLNESGSP